MKPPTPALAAKSLPQLSALHRVWKARLASRRRRLDKVRRTLTSHTPRTALTPERKLELVDELDAAIKQAIRTIDALHDAIVWQRMPLRLRALEYARADVGIREQGGNNRGPEVDGIIRENGGTGPEPWCGDAAARWYRRAGSKAVTRKWAGVWFFGRITGTRRLAVRAMLPGDLVCFRWPSGGDHVGILDRFCDDAGRPMPAATATHVRTIDGNTNGGAVSDSTTGDGVWPVVRAIGLVERGVRVTR